MIFVGEQLKTKCQNVTCLDPLRREYSKKDMEVGDDKHIELVYLEQKICKTEIEFFELKFSASCNTTIFAGY